MAALHSRHRPVRLHESMTDRETIGERIESGGEQAPGFFDN
jgi:hypothetical protein